MTDERDDRIEKALAETRDYNGDLILELRTDTMSLAETVRTLLTESRNELLEQVAQLLVAITRATQAAEQRGAKDAYLRCAANCAVYPHMSGVFAEWAAEADRKAKEG